MEEEESSSVSTSLPMGVVAGLSREPSLSICLHFPSRYWKIKGGEKKKKKKNMISFKSGHWARQRSAKKKGGQRAGGSRRGFVSAEKESATGAWLYDAAGGMRMVGSCRERTYSIERDHIL